MSIFTSPVSWALIIAFFAGGLNALLPVVPAGWAAIITAIVTALGILAHNSQIKAGSVKP